MYTFNQGHLGFCCDYGLKKNKHSWLIINGFSQTLTINERNVTLPSINLGFYSHPLGVVIVPFTGHLHADGLMLTPHLDLAGFFIPVSVYQYSYMFLWLLLLPFGITRTIFTVYVATSILSPVQYLFGYLLEDYKSFNAIPIERCLCMFFVSCYPFFQWLVAALGISLQGDQLKVVYVRSVV